MFIFIDHEGNYPRFIGDVLTILPNWEEGDALPNEWQLVQETPVPLLESDDVLYEDSPAIIDGVLRQVWVTRKMTEQEIADANAPITAKAKLLELGLTEAEIRALARGIL